MPNLIAPLNSASYQFFHSMLTPELCHTECHSIFPNPSDTLTSMKIRTITTQTEICNAAYQHQLYFVVFSLITL